MDKSYSLAQFIMNCGDYELALNLISFYMFLLRKRLHTSQQIPATTSGDLFHDRMLNLLWGRLTCESLMSLDDGMTTLKELEDALANIEVLCSALRSFLEGRFGCSSAPRAIVAGSLRPLLAQRNEERRGFLRANVLPQRVGVAAELECRYLATIELNAPWLLRYLVVVFMKQGRAARVNLSRVIEVETRRRDESCRSWNDARMCWKTPFFSLLITSLFAWTSHRRQRNWLVAKTCSRVISSSPEWAWSRRKRS